MEVTELESDAGRFSLRGECPHCQRSSIFVQVTSLYAEELSQDYQRLTVGMRCQGCLDYILAIAMKTRKYNQPTTLAYVRHYPLGKPDDSVDQNVPESIARDFAEAKRCLWVKCYKATVVMCRRSVEASCKQLGATGRDLEKKIDNLASQGKITEPLRQMAHVVRLSGNRGAHGKKRADEPQSAEAAVQQSDDVQSVDDLDMFGEDEAQAMIDFVEQFFQHVYVMPALLEKYKPKGKPEQP